MGLCTKCGLREAVYIAPGEWCDNCWIDWWCEGVLKSEKNTRKRAAYRREIKRAHKRMKKERRRQEKREA